VTPAGGAPPAGAAGPQALFAWERVVAARQYEIAVTLAALLKPSVSAFIWGAAFCIGAWLVFSSADAGSFCIGCVVGLFVWVAGVLRRGPVSPEAAKDRR
jgi:hypothetical protein